MAEFQEVMRQWVRVRKATASNADENILSVYPLEAYDDALIADIEKNVMAWAAVHPEPEYPTWWEWLFSVGAVTRKVKPDVASTLIETGLLDPIPADTAQKLGVKPKPKI